MTEGMAERGRGYRGLFAFKKARELAAEVIRITEGYPKSEIYGTVSQMRRAALSIASNIAEGARRGSRPEFIRFLRIAYGSCGELDAQAQVSRDAEWIDEAAFSHLEALINDVSGLIWLLMEAIRQKKRRSEQVDKLTS